jgi:hypothetical protein
MPNDSWDSYEQAAQRGPLSFLFKIILPIVVIGVVLIWAGSTLNWCGETAQVAQQELGPSALLQKYMWLKEAHAQLEKKQADIKVYQATLQDLLAQNAGTPRAKWAREDRDTYNQHSAELAGVKASYNDLAAQYNAKMAEVNWSFTNVGTLPKGATEPLPREYVTYTEN